MHPGIYTVTESNIPNGWQLVNTVCSASGGTRSTWSDTTNGKKITLAPGETVTVTFTDYKKGQITVTKSVNWNGVTPIPDKTFQVCITGPSYPEGDCKPAGYQGSTLTWSNLIPGEYTVTETDPGNEWTVTVPSNAVTIAPGGMATATVSNVHKLSSLTLAVTSDETACCGGHINYKVALTNNNPDFATTNIVVKDFLDLNTMFKSATSSDGTTFDQGEMQWTIPSLGQGASVSLNLVAICSQTYIGTITNQVKILSFDQMANDLDNSNVVTTRTQVKGCGSITIIKKAIPNDVTTPFSAQEFTYSGTLGPFTLVDDGAGKSNSKTFDNLEPGNYRIVEQSQSGWLLSFIPEFIRS